MGASEERAVRGRVADRSRVGGAVASDGENGKTRADFVGHGGLREREQTILVILDHECP